MRYNTLDGTDIRVSTICLGSMTWGEQNNPREACAQLDYAVAQGVNFIDTAELYAVPARAQTYGASERIIGDWLAARGHRDQLVIASKIAGPGPDWIPHIRGGHTRYDAQHIGPALDASLRRLQTDYIDLYQLHWPERSTNYFGKLGYEHVPDGKLTPFVDTLEALQAQVAAGKVRQVGLSNETPWGMMRFLQAAERAGLPRMVSVQNPYSLLNRTFEIGCAEVALREGVGLLAYSPLGFGVLSGKYLDDAHPAGARITRWPDYSRYSNDEAVAATRSYVGIARRHGLDPAQMALAYVNTRPFLAANIIGATDMEQLAANIASTELQLSAEVLQEIEDAHRAHPNPAP